MRTIFISLTSNTMPVLLLALIGTVAQADTELPIFVAENGVDGGDCTNIESPCATVSYALSRAGKSNQVRVASGRYSVSDAADIIRIVSGATDIVGGYRFDQGNPNDRRGTTVLVGVPANYRDQLASRGFEIVADRKGDATTALNELSKMDAAQSRLKSGIAAANCIGGFANGLPCSNIDLLSHVSHANISAMPPAGNDIWGFVDLNTGREYVIAGFDIGTAVFDVTDAANPREVGFVDGQSEVWRDIKVYQFFDSGENRWKAYAYVTTDGSTTDGLFVIDLTALPHAISRVNYQSDFLSAHNIYAADTDYRTPIPLTGNTPTLIIAGSNIGNGNYRAYSLANPASPAFIAGGNGTGYMHDASSIIITDTRKDTQCINGTTYCEVLLDYNEDTIEIWDITNASSPVRLSTTPYANVGYVHSGWWSEDKQYLFVQDETDELNFNLQTTLRVFSMA
ncbi:MAG: choice-of-anchor B family protein, partial [Gammaproteobacteria bacterium]|nr:choice-of-anchor B family protein [Gammaproteobacteria bacterium]